MNVHFFGLKFYVARVNRLFIDVIIEYIYVNMDGEWRANEKDQMEMWMRKWKIL